MTDIVGTDLAYRERIATYYDRTQGLYSRLWSPRGVHFGFWTADTRSRREAIINMDVAVHGALGSVAGGRLLDAGCGVAGTSIFMAERGARVVGLTLSEDQLARGRRNLRDFRLDDRCELRIGDYLDSGLPDASFDGAYAIESVCYAQCRDRFAAEMFRILRPGGRLVVADGFRSGDVSAASRRRYRRFCDGMAMEDLAGVESFAASLEGAGFVDVRSSDRTAEILPSARRIQWLSWPGVVISVVGASLRVAPWAWVHHGLAGTAQRRLWLDGVMQYRVFTAEKPAVG